MRVKVLFFAELGEIFGSSRQLEVADGATVGEVSEIFSRESERFLMKKDILIFAVNETYETAEKKLADQDELAILTPMSGG